MKYQYKGTNEQNLLEDWISNWKSEHLKATQMLEKTENISHKNKHEGWGGLKAFASLIPKKTETTESESESESEPNEDGDGDESDSSDEDEGASRVQENKHEGWGGLKAFASLIPKKTETTESESESESEPNDCLLYTSPSPRDRG